MYVCMYLFIYVCVQCVQSVQCVCVCSVRSVCVCVCTCIYIYIIYTVKIITHTHTHTHRYGSKNRYGSFRGDPDVCTKRVSNVIYN